jgi:microcompartment protein CcmL/EutN
MLREASVDLIFSSPLCPGKYVSIIEGTVDSVRRSLQKAERVAPEFLLDSQLILNPHEQVSPAISGTTMIDSIENIGGVETMGAIASVKAADLAAKSSNIKLIEVRIARGLGGKSYVVFCGELASVKNAIAVCLEEIGEEGGITSSTVVAAVHPQLVPFLF